MKVTSDDRVSWEASVDLFIPARAARWTRRSGQQPSAERGEEEEEEDGHGKLRLVVVVNANSRVRGSKADHEPVRPANGTVPTAS